MTKTKHAILTLLLCILLINIPTAYAADVEQFGIDIQITLENEKSVNYKIADYQQNEFIYQSTDLGKYIIAEYNQNESAYVLTGYTDNKELATHLCAGNNPANPHEIILTNLPSGTYEISQFASTDKHAMLPSNISVVLSDQQTTVDNNIVTPMNNGHITFSIQLASLELPKSEPEWQSTLKDILVVTLIYAPFILICIVAILYVHIKNNKNCD